MSGAPLEETDGVLTLWEQAERKAAELRDIIERLPVEPVVEALLLGQCDGLRNALIDAEILQ